MTVDDVDGFPVVEQERIPFEVAETVAYAIVAGTLLVIVTEVATTVISAFSSPTVPNGAIIGNPAFPGPTIAQTLVRATEWATPYFPVLLFGLLGTIWWQLRAWSEVVEDPEENAEETLRHAFGHLLRARTLSTTALMLSSTTVVAVVVGVIGAIAENAQISGQAGSLVLSADIDVVGEGLATCVLACACIWAGVYFRHSINETFAESDDEPFDTELDETEESDRL
jgi:hypothetical protein